MRWISLLCVLLLLPACNTQESPDTKTKEEDASKKTSQLTEPANAQREVKATPIVPPAVAQHQKHAAAEPPVQDVAEEQIAEEQVAEESDLAQTAYDEVTKAYMAEQREYSLAIREAKTPQERQKIYEDQYPKPEKYAPQMLELAKEHPNSEVAPKALMWVVQRLRGPGHNDYSKQAQQLMLDNHIDSESMADFALALMYETPSQDIEDVFQKLIDESPHERVRGIASYVRAFHLNRGLQSLVRLEGMDDEDGNRVQQYLNGAGAMLTALHTDGKTADGETIESMFEKVIENYGDVVLYDRGDSVTKVGPKAEGALFEIRHLSIGKVAPDIVGEDIDGEEFKLSDYRGKVVMLDFWGDW